MGRSVVACEGYGTGFGRQRHGFAGLCQRDMQEAFPVVPPSSGTRAAAMDVPALGQSAGGALRGDAGPPSRSGRGGWWVGCPVGSDVDRVGWRPARLALRSATAGAPGASHVAGCRAGCKGGAKGGVDGPEFRCIIALLCCNFPSVIRKTRVACSLLFNRMQPIGVGAGVLGGLVLGVVGLVLDARDILVLTRRKSSCS